MDEIIRRGIHRAFAMQHLPISREDILRLINLCNQELESRRLQEIGEVHQMILPAQGQTIWGRVRPDLDLLPDFLFWIDKGVVSSLHPNHAIINRYLSGHRTPGVTAKIIFKDLILDRASFNRVVEQAISVYGSQDAYHRNTTAFEEPLDYVGWVIYHHAPGKPFEAVGLLPELARRSAPGSISPNAPILSLEVALEEVWKIISPTLV